VGSAQWAPTGVAIAYVEGNVYVDNRRLPQVHADDPVNENSVVRTEKGRAEVRFNRGDTLFPGENNSARVKHDPNTNSGGIEILTGSAVVITGEVGPTVTCEETVYLSDAGIFRLNVHRAAGENLCELKVYKGAAGAQMSSFVWMLTAGKLIDLNHRCGDHTPRWTFNVDDIDVLDRWSRGRAGI
jgi:hypothetical protein